jgi:hypothetical protein
MIWILYIGGGFLTIFALILGWGFLHSRQSKSKALQEIQNIELADIDSLTKECVEVFKSKLGVPLDLNNCDDAAQKLDDACRMPFKLKSAFERPGFYWHFIKPVGACLGELLRRHAKHEWHKKPGQTPYMEVLLKDGSSTVFPFEKIMKQVQSGEPGDLVAYVVFARTIEQATQQMTQE